MTWSFTRYKEELPACSTNPTTSKAALLLTALAGTVIAADKPFTKKQCQDAPNVETFRQEIKEPLNYCKFLRKDRAFALSLNSKAYFEAQVLTACDCIESYKSFQSSLKGGAVKLGKNPSKQVKAMTFISWYFLSPSADPLDWCRAWEKVENRTVSPASVPASTITKRCQEALHPPTSQIGPADAAAPNLFLNPTFQGNGSYTVERQNLTMTPWNATSGVVEPRTWVDYIKGNVTEVILYNIGNDKNLNTASMEQEVANFTIGSSYRIWLNERWSCMSLFDDAASAKGACRWEVLVDGKSVYSRLSNAGESRPDAKYPTRHRVTGPIVFNASEKSHDIAFKATRVAKDVGQAAWMINKVVLTGPW